jgi:hypothetical protein
MARGVLVGEAPRSVGRGIVDDENVDVRAGLEDSRRAATEAPPASL